MATQPIFEIPDPPKVGAHLIPKFMPAIDGLRAFAVLAVVLLHFHYPLAQDVLWDKLHINGLVRCGFAGVDLFFVISGFLITGILLDTKGSHDYFRNFYIRRALRIWPLYYAVLVLVLVVYPHLHPTGSMVHLTARWYWYVFYLQNFKSFESRLLGVTWSLAVEEQFYITWPLVVLLLSRKNLRRLILSLLVAAPVLRWVARGHGDAAFDVLTFCRMDGILAGSLLALWLRSANVSVLQLRKVAAGLLLIGGMGSTVFLLRGGERSIPVFSFLAMAFSGLLCFAAIESITPRPFRALLNNSWLRYIGKISYGIYLFHPIVHQALIFLIPRLRIPLGRSTASQDAVYLLVDVVLVIAVASLSWWGFEQPILGMKKRFEYSKSANEVRPIMPLAAVN